MRWSPPFCSENLYPFKFDTGFLRFGYLGVNFFFIISGFVIAYTLKETSGFFQFWKKRMIRLVPAMFLCSLITLVTLNFLDDEGLFPQGHSTTNFLGSLSFLPPKILNAILKPIDTSVFYTSGSYWSLWPEIQFYLLISILYFTRPKSYVPLFSVTGTLLFVLHDFSTNLDQGTATTVQGSRYIGEFLIEIQGILNLGRFILWFMFGVHVFELFSNRKNTSSMLWLAAIGLLLIYDGDSWPVKFVTIVMMLLFISFLYFPMLLKPFKNPFLTYIGLISYSIYLIHESIGVLLIHKYGGLWGRYAALFPFFVMAIIIILSAGIYKYFEKPLGSWLRRNFVK